MPHKRHLGKLQQAMTSATTIATTMPTTVSVSNANILDLLAPATHRQPGARPLGVQ
jgi:ABC-type tungstate transport system permease subunit